MALDYAFMDLSADTTGPLGGVLDGQLDYFAGLRWWDNDVDVTIDPTILPGTVSSSVGEDWIDLVVGVRWKNPISKKWSVLLHGDIGGIASDFTAAGIAGFSYKIGKSMELDLQDKALYVDYETGVPGQPGYFMYDTTTHGPIVGYTFNF